jgi:hypothetical protein
LGLIAHGSRSVLSLVLLHHPTVLGSELLDSGEYIVHDEGPFGVGSVVDGFGQTGAEGVEVATE